TSAKHLPFSYAMHFGPNSFTGGEATAVCPAHKDTLRGGDDRALSTPLTASAATPPAGDAGRGFSGDFLEARITALVVGGNLSTARKAHRPTSKLVRALIKAKARLAQVEVRNV